MVRRIDFTSLEVNCQHMVSDIYNYSMDFLLDPFALLH